MAEVATEPIPLVQDANGVMRVRGTRVTLDTVFAAFREGATQKRSPAIPLDLAGRRVSGDRVLPAPFSEVEGYLFERRAAAGQRGNTTNPVSHRTASVIGCSRGVGRSDCAGSRTRISTTTYCGRCSAATGRSM